MMQIAKILSDLFRISGGTDGTVIGNVGDALKVTAAISNTSVVGIDFSHYMIHVGRSFSLEHIFTISAGGTHDHLIVTPATGTRYPHTTYHVDGAGDTTFELYAAPTATQGSELVPVNRNRNSSNVNTTKIYNVSNITNTGTLISTARVGMAGGGGNNGANDDHAKSEFILKANTTYLWRIISNTNNNIINSSIEWYEYDYANPP